MKRPPVLSLVATRLAQAEATLRDAEILHTGNGDPRSTVNRSYYAAFYAVLALLQIIKKVPRSHDGAVSLFDAQFIRTGLLKKRFSEILHQLFRARLEDDYERLDPVTRREAEKALKTAGEFVAEVRRYIEQNARLNP